MEKISTKNKFAVIWKQEAGPAGISPVTTFQPVLCHQMLKSELKAEKKKCDEINRKDWNYQRSSSGIMKHLMTSWIFIRPAVTAGCCRPGRHRSNSHTSGPELGLGSFGGVWKTIEGRMRYSGGKLTRCLNRFCRLLLIQRRKRLLSEHHLGPDLGVSSSR